MVTYLTDLDLILKALDIKYLSVPGCTTSVCVESALADATARHYSCLLLAGCTGESNVQQILRSNHAASHFIIERLFGWVSQSAKFIKALDSQAVVTRV